MRPWWHSEGKAVSVWRGPERGMLPGRASCERWPELSAQGEVAPPAGNQPRRRGGSRCATGSFRAGPVLFGLRRKEVNGSRATRGRSEGKMPTAKEGKARQRLGVIVRGEDLAHLHSVIGERPGGLL